MTDLAAAPAGVRLGSDVGKYRRLHAAAGVNVGKPINKTAAAPEPAPETERRRVGKVVHDKRGNAIVEWENAPADYQRPVLEVDDGSGRADENAFNPYARKGPCDRQSTGNTTRTDLRKLSEWIKQMRELEARKRDGNDQDPED